MDPQRLSQLIHEAQNEAIVRRNLYMTSEHLLWALLHTSEVKRAFSHLGISRQSLIKKLEQYFDEDLEIGNEEMPSEEAFAMMTPKLEALINRTLLHGVSAGVLFPRAIDFIIILIGDEDSYAAALMQSLGLTRLALMRWAASNPEPAQSGTAHVHRSASATTHQRQNASEDGDDAQDDASWEESGFNGFEEGDNIEDDEEIDAQSTSLGSFLVELVARAHSGLIDPVIGREKEIDACCQTLLRRNKRNVMIIGESGVGKTAIVEGLALRIASGNVPPLLSEVEIFSLDVTSLMAGTKFRGEMESRLRRVTQFVKQRPAAVLFIDEIHAVAGNSVNGNGAQDILSFLKSSLADGSLRVIGTTTHVDFRRSLSEDAALMRRFYRLPVDEPSAELTRRILGELRSKYEDFHDVLFDEAALDSAVKLTDRFITDRRFPDKAIDIIDEAGAANRMKALGDQLRVIGESEIETIVAKVAQIPEITASQDERELLKDAEASLARVVFGQDKAISSIIQLVKLSRAGLRSVDKPVGSFLFAGPTGVGKTEIARQLAKTLKLSFVRFDMSEYREEYTVSRFIGSAPGYVGYDKGGLLTEAIRANPRCVLLLDEIEKAHSSIYDLLLQVMDAARLTDNAGRVADFKNVILIMTSNAGGSEMGQISIGYSSSIDVSRGLKAIENQFSPEFRNRLDEIVVFNPLTPMVMTKIVDKMLAILCTQIAERNVSIELQENAREWLAKEGFDERFGARPLARLIQKELSFALSEAILFGDLKNGGKAIVGVKEDRSGLALSYEADAPLQDTSVKSKTKAKESSDKVGPRPQKLPLA